MVETLTQKAEKFFRAIPPIPQNIKDEFLDRVRDRVSHYQPRIEDRCNVRLGEMDVRDYKEKYGHLCRVVITDREFSEGLLADKIVDVLLWTSMQALRPALSPLHGQRTGCFMNYMDSTIYIPFNLRRRLFISLEESEESINQGVVHELSHRLWEVLSGDNVTRDTHGDLNRLFVEGFASYCDSDYFSDFYPKGSKLIEHNDELYGCGRQKIKKLVERYGQGIVLEIPERWKELENDS